MSERIVVTGGPWPERIGCEGVVVDPSVFDGVYPADKRDKDRVIVLLDRDPLVPPTGDHRCGRCWTCVYGCSDVAPIPPVETGDTDE